MKTWLGTLLGSCLVLLGSALFADSTGDNGAVHLAQFHTEAVITITASFPGANAEIVDDTLAAPIEQQVNGVEGMVSLSSTSKSDGSYVAEVAFKPDTDLARALVLVQNRVSLAVPILPDSVTKTGISVRAKSPGVLMFVALTSSNGRFDTKYLGDYVDIYLKDELVRVAGVSHVSTFGRPKNCLRLNIDSKALEAKNLTVSDVIAALRKSAQTLKNQKKPPVSDKSQFQITMPDGKFWMPEKILDQFLKAGGNGRAVRLKDIAKLEVTPVKNESQGIWNGHPAICLAIWSAYGANCRDAGDKLMRRLRELEQRFPAGMRLDIAYDCTQHLADSDKDYPSPYFALDIDMPKNAAAKKSGAILTQCNSLLRDTKRVADILAITENPFDQTARDPWILLRLANTAEKQDTADIAAFVHERLLQQIAGVGVRRPTTRIHHGFLRTGYPLAASLHGPDVGKVSQWAEKLLVELNQEKRLIDAWIDPAILPTAQPRVEINNSKLTARGIKAGDVADTIRVLSDILRDQEVARFGPWPVVMQMDGKSGPPIDYLKTRDSEGKLIPLAEFVTLRKNNAPQSIHRVDLRQSIPITANTVSGVSLGDAQACFAKVADRVRNELNLPATYGIRWLTPR